MKWQPIKTAPKDDTIIDIWSKEHGRCTNYVRIDYYHNGKNIFYDPVECGITTIRDATHWMIVKPPNINRN